MNASSTTDLAAEYAAVLRGVGLSRSDLDDPHVDEGPLTPETVRWDLSLEDPDEAYVQLQQTLARSDRGIEAPRRYWNHAPAFQLNDVLERYGYEVEFEAPGGGPFQSTDGTFDVAFHDGDSTDRITFSYPPSEEGEDNYPALVHAVETQLLPRDDLQFVLLDGHEDAWRFLLVEDEDLAELREERGERVRVFGRPLLAADQPEAYVGDGSATADDHVGDLAPAGLVGGFDAVVAASGIDDVFETIEREAATQPVGPGSTDEAVVDEDVDEIITSVETGAGVGTPTVRDVSGEALDEAVEGFAAEPPAVEEASAVLGAAGATPETSTGTDDAPDGTADGRDGSTDDQVSQQHVPSPDPGRRSGGGLSSQVAATLYSEEPETGPDRTDSDEPTADEFVPAVQSTDGTADADEDVPSVVDVGEDDDGPSDPDDAIVDDPFEDERSAETEPVIRPVGDDEEESDDEEPRGRIGRFTDTVRSLF